MDLQTVWFVLVAVLFAGYFVLEGFDFGVGMLLPFLSKQERTAAIKAIGPVWDGNEVWLITAGGALLRLSLSGMPPCFRVSTCHCSSF